jgi:hypothetical protein
MNIIISAIRKINKNSEFKIFGNDINQITWLNNTPPIPKEQILAMIPIVEQEIANEEANKIANKQSALNKLSALGLTEAEIKAIIG